MLPVGSTMLGNGRSVSAMPLGILHCHSISEDVMSSSHAMCAAGREVKSRDENQLADASSQPLRGRWLGLDSSLRRRPAPRVPSSKLTKLFLRPLGSGADTIEAYANLSMRDTPLASPRCAAIEALNESVLQIPFHGDLVRKYTRNMFNSAYADLVLAHACRWTYASFCVTPLLTGVSHLIASI